MLLTVTPAELAGNLHSGLTKKPSTVSAQNTTQSQPRASTLVILALGRLRSELKASLDYMLRQLFTGQGGVASKLTAAKPQQDRKKPGQDPGQLALHG